MTDDAVLQAIGPTRVLLADDDPIVLAALRAQLEPRFSVVATAASADGAVALAGDHRPDLALLDVEMPGGGLLATRGIREVSPDTAIVILTADDSRSSVLQFLEAGAIAYLRKGLPARLMGPQLLEVITAHRALITRAGRQRKAADDRFHAAFEQAAVGMAIVALEGPEAGMLAVANRAYATMIGREAGELTGANPEQWTHPDDLPDGVTDPLAVLARGDVERIEFEQRYLRPDGRVISAMGTAASFVDEDARRAAIIQVLDISERKRFERELEYLAGHDTLTGLLNRRRFAEELDRELVRAKRYGGRGALLLVDLDGFKVVNDSLGHAAGDELVATLATTMRHGLRESDIVARTGGDEFVVLMPEADMGAALVVAEKLLVAIRQEGTALRGDRRASVTASIGVTVFEHGDELTAEGLMVEADIAMYDAKQEGKNRACVHRRDEHRREQISPALRARNEPVPVGGPMTEGADGTPAPRYLDTALAALQSLPDCSVLVFDADLRLVLVAGGAVSESGFDPAEMEGRPAADVLSPERWAFWEPLYRDAVQGRGTSVEVQGVDSSRWFEVELGPWQDGNGAGGGMAVARDVTERKRARDQFEGLLESAPDAMVVVDDHGVIVLVNALAEELFGYERGELVGQRVELLVPLGTRDAHARQRSGYTADRRARGMGVGLELAGRRKDGSEFPVEISLSPLNTEEGTFVSSAIRDVSERRRLEGLAGHLAAVVESSVDAIISKTIDGTIVSWNPGAQSLYGYAEAEAVGQSISMLVPEGHEDEVSHLLARARRGESVEQFETVRRRKDGSVVDVSLTLSAVRDGTGQITGASTIARDITAQKRSDAALAQARADIDRFFGLSLDVMAIADSQGHFVRVNPAFERTLGYSLQELTGRPFMDFVHPDDVASTVAQYAELLTGANACGFENRYRAQDGSYRWLLWNATAAHDGLVYCTGVDVTERKRMEESVREAEQLLSLAFEHSPHGMTLASPDRRIARVNRAFADMLGYSVQELLDGRQTTQQFSHPDDLATDVENLRPLIDGEADRASWEKRYIHADGHTVWAHVSVSALRHRDGTLRLMIGQVQDITARRRIEQELQASEQRLAMAQRAAGVGTWDWNVVTDVIFWAPEMEEIYGLAPGGFEGRYEGWSRTVHPDDLPIAEAGLSRAVDTQTDWQQEFRIVRADGAERWIAASGRPYVNAAGERHVVGVNLDITERKLAERQLTEAARYFELSSDMVCTAGFDGFFKALNGAWTQTLGWTADELLAKPFIEFVHPDDRPGTSDETDRTSAGQATARFVNRYLTRDGGWRWLEWNSTTLPEERAIYASARDVTVRIEAEQAILAAEAAAATARDEALGASAMKSAFLANMSHEIRTPLNGVIGMADLLLDSRLDHEQSEHARLLKTAGQTLVTVVDDILDFSKLEARGMRLECVDLDLPQTVEDTCDLMADGAQRKGVELTLDLDPALPEIVRGDAVRLRQIITNLLSNAVKFTADGEVRITLRALEATASKTTVRCEVSDTGIGIDADRLEQMFEPFIQEDDSTTRRFGGTGLGLAIVKQLVEMMGGEVGVSSARGHGSTFWFTLPLEHGDAVPPKMAGGPLAGTRLLVVDDDEASRRRLVQLAERCELPVTAVPDAARALAELRAAAARHEPFQCAAIDIDMPGTDGIELADAIRRDESVPTPALVMLTTTTDQRRDARRAGIDIHLTKPVRRSRLHIALSEALGLGIGRDERTTERALGEGPESASPILIVEDNNINQILAVKMLEKRGYQTDIAGDGLQALAKLKLQPYAAVLMDCQMPELNGYDATRQLRDREAGRTSIPVIAMTANALRGDREKCLASGMDDYLPKPLRPEDLDRVLQRWAPLPQADPGPEHAPDHTETPAAPPVSVLDPTAIEVFLDESGDVARTIVEIFGSQTPLLLTQMRAAIEASDTTSLCELSHKLRGSCLTIGADRMAAHCERLECRAREGITAGAATLVDEIETSFTATYDALIAHTDPRS